MQSSILAEHVEHDENMQESKSSASELKWLIAPRILQSSNPIENFHLSEHNEGGRRNDCDE
jgi:hypothetical protein